VLKVLRTFKLPLNASVAWVNYSGISAMANTNFSTSEILIDSHYVFGDPGQM
jgi:hypothetical protein